MSDERVRLALAANIEILGALLKEVVARIEEADTYLKNGQRKAAIGTLVDLDEPLAEAAALHRAVVALHRRQAAQP